MKKKMVGWIKTRGSCCGVKKEQRRGAWAGIGGLMEKGLRKRKNWKQIGWEGSDDRTVIKAPTNKCSAAH